MEERNTCIRCGRELQEDEQVNNGYCNACAKEVLSAQAKKENVKQGKKGSDLTKREKTTFTIMWIVIIGLFVASFIGMAKANKDRQEMVNNAFFDGQGVPLEDIADAFEEEISQYIPTTPHPALSILESTTTPATPAPEYGYIDADELYLRAAPSSEGEILGTYTRGQEVVILGQEQEWVHVSLDGQEGYMALQYIQQGEAEETQQPAHDTSPSAAATTGQRNALASARDYLQIMAFSKEGLIEQLEYEGYTASEAEYAAENCGADWMEQAAEAAQSYLDVMSFSREGLIEQLEYEGFTAEQAEYGVSAVGY